MEKFREILEDIQSIFCRTYTKVLTHIYSTYRTRSAPVNYGELSLYFETYNPALQKVCDKLDISIPPHQAKAPGRLTKRFLSWFFGWPWPVRILVYKGKRLDAIAIKPEEMARLIQEMWDASVAGHKDQKELSDSRLSKPVPVHRSKGENGARKDVKSKVITRIVNPHRVERQNEGSPSMESSFPDPANQIKEEVKKIVTGAVLDNSF